MVSLPYSDGDVEITEAIARFGATSYPIKNIGAVSVEEKKIGFKSAAVSAVIIGLLSMIWLPLWIGILLFALGIIFFFKKPEYEMKLVLATSSGNQQAFTSRDKKAFEEVRRALETAIATKG